MTRVFLTSRTAILTIWLPFHRPIQHWFSSLLQRKAHLCSSQLRLVHREGCIWLPGSTLELLGIASTNGQGIPSRLSYSCKRGKNCDASLLPLIFLSCRKENISQLNDLIKKFLPTCLYPSITWHFAAK